MLDKIWQMFDLSMFKRNDLEKIIKMSNEAKMILESEVVNKFFDDTEKFFYNKIIESKIDEVSVRENAYRYINILRKFKEHFELYVKCGEEAKTVLYSNLENYMEE